MAYEFKRLSDVEELTEAPENATALAVIDGTIKRVPVGSGNLKVEDLRFDIELGEMTNGSIFCTNMEQIQRVIDNKMLIRIVSIQDQSGFRYVYNHEIHCDPDCLSIVNSSGYVTSTIYTEAGATSARFVFDTAEYEKGNLVVIDATISFPQYLTLVKVYASLI